MYFTTDISMKDTEVSKADSDIFLTMNGVAGQPEMAIHSDTDVSMVQNIDILTANVTVEWVQTRSAAGRAPCIALRQCPFRAASRGRGAGGERGGPAVCPVSAVCPWACGRWHITWGRAEASGAAPPFFLPVTRPAWMASVPPVGSPHHMTSVVVRPSGRAPGRRMGRACPIVSLNF